VLQNYIKDVFLSPPGAKSGLFTSNIKLVFISKTLYLMVYLIRSTASQVTDGELEDIVRLGQSTHALMAPPVGLPSGRGSALVADYSARTLSTLPTPQRTPVQEDVIMQEARNQRALRNMTGLLVEQEPGRSNYIKDLLSVFLSPPWYQIWSFHLTNNSFFL
jgi:hypothetical protein